MDDPDFSGAPATRHANPERQQRSWAKPGRERHPKLYLKFLCDPDDPFGKTYREAVGCKAALELLDWPRVLAHPTHVRFARALVADIADGLGVVSPLLG